MISRSRFVVGKLSGGERPGYFVISRNSDIYYSRNSIVWWIINSAVRIISFVFRLRRAGSHSYFLAKIHGAGTLPEIEVFSEQRRKIPLYIDSSDFRWFDSRSAENTGYWLPGSIRLQSVFPNSKLPDTVLRGFADIKPPYWVPLLKDNWDFESATSIRNVSQAEIHRNNLVVAQSGGLLIDIDPQQASETTRREVFSSDTGELFMRKHQGERIELEHATYLSSNLDFLFFEALVYGLPKIASLFSQENLPLSSTPLVSSSLHPSVRKLWSAILESRGLTIPISPTSNRIYSVASLDILLGGTDWLESLEKCNEELATFVEIAKSRSTSGLKSSDKLILIRNQQARDFSNRVPLNYGSLVDYKLEEGYQPVDLGALSIFDQIALMSSAREIISVHGGALAHLVWSPPGTKVQEIFSGWKDDCFQKLAEHRGLEYSKISGEPVIDITRNLRATMSYISRSYDSGAGATYLPKFSTK